MASISITWHMHENSGASAEEVSDGEGRLTIHDGKPYMYPDLNIYVGSFTAARLAATAINGELGRALAKLVRDHEDLQDETEGRYPPPDAGCIDCTSGTVPNDIATGRCAYHLAKWLGIEAPKPARAPA